MNKDATKLIILALASTFVISLEGAPTFSRIFKLNKTNLTNFIENVIRINLKPPRLKEIQIPVTSNKIKDKTKEEPGRVVTEHAVTDIPETSTHSRKETYEDSEKIVFRDTVTRIAITNKNRIETQDDPERIVFKYKPEKAAIKRIFNWTYQENKTNELNDTTQLLNTSLKNREFVTNRKNNSIQNFEVNVTVFAYNNFEGASKDFKFSQECLTLPDDWRKRISSVNTHDSCVEVCELRNCKGRCIQVAPGTAGHNRLRQINFDKKITSIRACLLSIHASASVCLKSSLDFIIILTTGLLLHSVV